MKNIIYLLLISLSVFSCKPAMEDDVDLGPTPSLDFTAEKVSSNRVKFKINSSNVFLHKFEFGNGESTKGDEFTAYYPFSGEYQVKLTGIGKAGTATPVIKTIKIDISDPSYPLCNDQDIINLSGGCEDLDGKAWVMDTLRGAMSVGPLGAKFDTTWYQNPKATASDCGYKSEFVFKLRGLVYENKNNGESKYGWMFANHELGQSNAMYNDVCVPYTPPTSSWSLVKDTVSKRMKIKLTNGGFLVLKEGATEYEIFKLNKDTLWVRWQYPENTKGDVTLMHGYRYWRLRAKK